MMPYAKYGNAGPSAERQIGFFLAPNFAMLPFVSAVEPLRAANRFSGRELYHWRVFSRDGDAVTASNRMTQAADSSIDEYPQLHTLFVCGPHDPHTYRERKVFAWLRTLAARDVAMGAMDTGSYLLARARLLNGHRCTIHWENITGFVQEFPNILVSNKLFEIDRNRLTCSGGTAALDMMLHLIRIQHGHELATAASELFIHDSIRRAHYPQRMDLRLRTGISHPRLLDCIAIMEANLEQPLTPAELAAAVAISRRQLERLFRHHLATTPTRYYLELRLQRSRRLLEQTSLSITEVSLACGFRICRALQRVLPGFVRVFAASGA